MSNFFEKARKTERSHRIRCPQTLEQKKERLANLTDQQEEGLCPDSVHVMARKLNQQVHQPTLRQRLFGFRPGRLRKEDEEFLRVMEITQEMKKIL